MREQPVSKRKRQASVFLNFPFDAEYEPLGIALVGSIVGLGREPHCVLEVLDGGQGRLGRLIDLMRSCAVSMHDLSRVQPDQEGFPRFNMPFELGLACFYAKTGRPGRHRFFVFEQKGHRLDRTLSDLKAIDPMIHGANPMALVRKVFDCLEQSGSGHSIMLSRSKLVTLVNGLTKAAESIKVDCAVEHVFEDASSFKSLVETATVILDEMRSPRGRCSWKGGRSVEVVVAPALAE